MTTIERKEFERKEVMRTVSPSRNFRSSSQNLAEFDHKLDYMLEDLQNSVSRPGSSLGGEITSRSTTLDTQRSNSLQRFNRSTNPVEYSSDDAYNYTSPDGRKHVSGYKKESYSYKTSGGGDIVPQEKVRMQNSINQLDSLLDDLQQVKSSSTFQESSYNSTGVDPDFRGNTNSLNKRSVQRELHYGETPRSSSRTRTLEREYTSEGTYGDLRPLRSTSPSPSSRTSTLSKQTKVTNLHSYPVEVVETTTPDINPEILSHLDPNLHPPGNTKVTTTIKTYTYEIPGSGPYPTNIDTTVESEKYVYSPNQSQTTPSKSFVYKKSENRDIVDSWENRIYKESDHSITSSTPNYPPYQKPAPPGGSTIVKETITTRNYQPEPIVNNQTYVYNETVTTKNYPPTPPQTYQIEERYHTQTNKSNYPPTPPQTYQIEERYHTQSNKSNYPNGYPPQDKTVIYKHETHTTNNYGGTGGKLPRDLVETFEPRRPPNEPINIQYKYKTESHTTNNYKAGYPPQKETEILLPKPFPTDTSPEGPPKKLDELMASIGHEPPNSPYNHSFTAHEQELVQRKKVESLKQQQQDELDDMQRKEPVQRSKNVTGPPVYYPPGHEMFAKKEEGGGAWRAQGEYERSSGKYQSGSEGGSKTKTKSGAAIVPVCLPLCCGLPCTII